MTSKPHRTPGEVIRLARRHTARTALVLAVLAALALFFAGFGVNQDMFDLDYAVGVLATGWAPGLAVLTAIFGLLALLAGLLVPPRRNVVTALVALVVAAGTYAASAEVKARAAANPPVHDVATDWTDPMMFGGKVVISRGQDANRLYADPVVQAQPQAPQLTGARVADVNARTCPGAVPVVLTGPAQEAYAKARAAMLKDGMVLVTENPAGGRIEALATTRWLKLKSDVLVRVKPEGAGTRVDIRSISRTGVADLGENCRRVTRFRTAMAK